MSGLIGVLLFALAVAVAVIVTIFVLVPIIKGLVWLIANLFKGIGWIIQHIFGFVFGIIGDAVRLIGSLLAMIVLAPMVPLNVIVGRWSAAGHFAESVKRECKVIGLCVYRIVLQRPLRLVLLHGLLEGLEHRVPEAMAGAPTSDRPSRRTGTFDGYTIVGSLRGGGSGGKLYIAQPTGTGRTARLTMPERVVIKSFALSDGSSLPQIVRESRALEAARKLGLVLDHNLDEHRFWYVMPYHEGDNLGVVTRQLHGESGDRGLTPAQLPRAMGYVHNLLETVANYHRGGLWHKDIKPENIIINRNGAHLVDLGLVTPLRSAMTLTTHGTEYFRDPEMVRQALRGVKVHQVDGAKFDIYAIGAVLYFMLENTFPAHGGLSRFARRSPEALRWIVRRAMADYAKRYDSADLLLADLEVVMAAHDPFAVRPADLPSMHGGAAPMVDAENDWSQDDVDDPQPQMRSAGSPSPNPAARKPWLEGYGLAAGIGANGPFAQAGHFRVDEDGNPMPESASAPRPALTVRNWWTGRYSVDLASAAATHGGAAMVDKARDVVRSGAHQARRAAREQVRRARSRARDMRSRAATHRVRATAERQPTPAVILTTLIVLGGIALLVLSIVTTNRRGSHGSWAADAAVTATGNAIDGPPLLVINDVPDVSTQGVQRRIDTIINHWRDGGYNVVKSDPNAQAVLSDLFDKWQQAPNGPADDRLEDALEQFNYYGLLYIWQPRDGRPPNYGIIGKYVYSTRDGAQQRRQTADAVEPSPVLLVNDHPDATNLDIATWIDDRLDAHRLDGYEIIESDLLAEATLQPQLQLWKRDGGDAVGNALARELTDLGYAGVLYMTEGQAFGPAKLRVNEMFFLADHDDALVADGHVHAAAATQAQRSDQAAPLLLVNDHPAKTDPAVDDAVRALIDRYRRDGLELIIDDDVEVLMRRLLPVGAVDPLQELSPVAKAALREHGLGGVVRIVARPGNAPAASRIDVERITITSTTTATTTIEADAVVDSNCD